MLFITPTASVQGAKDYFARALAQGDYYVQDAGEAPGEWHGLGAELLGLTGEVRREEFFRLCENRDPLSGEPLTARTKAGRRVLFDFTFDAPKAVSLAYEVGGDSRVPGAFRAAVAETMAEIEGDMQARVRAGGADEDRRTSNLIWAKFLHRTTRPVDGVPDPHLHCHAVAFNATFDTSEGRWKAGQFGGIVRDKLYYQAAFHARLAGRLQELGYGVRRDGTSFALEGIGRQTTAKFSRRTAQIEEAAARKGISDPQAKGELGRRTRERKAAGGSMAELRRGWGARISEAERSSLRAAAGASTSREELDTMQEASGAMGFAVAHSFERASVVPERRLVAEALMQGVGTVRVGEVWDALRSADVLRRPVGDEVLATTRAVYREEVTMLDFARRGRGQCQRLGGSTPPVIDPGLSDEQRHAAERMLASRDRVIGLRGGAGTGKTRMMQATVHAIERAGRAVFTFAPSAKASRGVLREEGFATADTVERLLTDRELQTATKGQVIWVDEAGLLSTRDMKRLFDLAAREGCRVVLSGDSAQHAAVGRGDALRLLEQQAGVHFARLSTIRRQTVEEYRAAVREISDGDARLPDGRTRLEAGIARLDRMGAIIELQGEARHRQLAADYATATEQKARLGRTKTALVVSPTHREGEQVAVAIRAELKRRGRLSGGERYFLSLRSLGLTEAQRSVVTSYGGGEVIRFNQNVSGFRRGERVTVAGVSGDVVNVRHSDGRIAVLPLKEAARFEVYEARSLALAAGDRLRITQNGFTRERKRAGESVKSRLNNGDIFEVAGFTMQGDIRLANGFVVPRDYGGIAQGYVVTSHASQGSTVDRVLIALGAQSLAAANRQQFYVSVSRGREAVRLYTDDRQGLMEAVKADASRLSATELLLGSTTRPKRAGSSAKVVSLVRARRAFEERRERLEVVALLRHPHAEAAHARH